MYRKDFDYPIEILIAEDNSLFKKVILDFLKEDPNFKIVGESKDGKTAVKLANELKPDLIIMDVGLPVMTGIEAMLKIKKTNPYIKIIALTSHLDHDEAVKTLAAGASAYVNKDIHISYMKMIIETVSQGAIWLSPSIGQRILNECINGRLK
jgi:DNA-binding NarL/FixJ family response regulator